ncbi:hypothetical protein ACVILK_000028 [Bradyrhizobium embrapense]
MPSTEMVNPALTEKAAKQARLCRKATISPPMHATTRNLAAR